MGKQRDGFGHERAYQGETNDWITPKYVIDELGPFDLDPCASRSQPWPCARKMYKPPKDGLSLPWKGRVFCNPPYGPHTFEWAVRMSEHKNGILLVFARMETQLWQDYILPTMSGMLLLRGRITFCLPSGGQPANNAGAPSALVAWGAKNLNALRKASKGRRLQGYVVVRDGK